MATSEKDVELQVEAAKPASKPMDARKKKVIGGAAGGLLLVLVAVLVIVLVVVGSKKDDDGGVDDPYPEVKARTKLNYQTGVTYKYGYNSESKLDQADGATAAARNAKPLKERDFELSAKGQDFKMTANVELTPTAILTNGEFEVFMKLTSIEIIETADEKTEKLNETYFAEHPDSLEMYFHQKPTGEITELYYAPTVEEKEIIRGLEKVILSALQYQMPAEEFAAIMGYTDAAGTADDAKVEVAAKEDYVTQYKVSRTNAKPHSKVEGGFRGANIPVEEEDETTLDVDTKEGVVKSTTTTTSANLNGQAPAENNSYTGATEERAFDAHGMPAGSTENLHLISFGTATASYTGSAPTTAARREEIRSRRAAATVKSTLKNDKSYKTYENTSVAQLNTAITALLVNVSDAEKYQKAVTTFQHCTSRVSCANAIAAVLATEKAKATPNESVLSSLLALLCQGNIPETRLKIMQELQAAVDAEDAEYLKSILMVLFEDAHPSADLIQWIRDLIAENANEEITLAAETILGALVDRKAYADEQDGVSARQIHEEVMETVRFLENIVLTASDPQEKRTAMVGLQNTNTREAYEFSVECMNQNDATLRSIALMSLPQYVEMKVCTAEEAMQSVDAALATGENDPIVAATSVLQQMRSRVPQAADRLRQMHDVAEVAKRFARDHPDEVAAMVDKRLSKGWNFEKYWEYQLASGNIGAKVYGYFYAAGVLNTDAQYYMDSARLYVDGGAWVWIFGYTSHVVWAVLDANLRGYLRTYLKLHTWTIFDYYYTKSTDSPAVSERGPLPRIQVNKRWNIADRTITFFSFSQSWWVVVLYIDFGCGVSGFYRFDVGIQFDSDNTAEYGRAWFAAVGGVNAYARAGPSLVVVRGGVQVEVNFLTILVQPYIIVGPEGNRCGAIYLWINTLSGKVFAYADAWYCADWCVFYPCDCGWHRAATWNLFGWTGYHYEIDNIARFCV